MKIFRLALVMLIVSTALVACGRRVTQEELMGIAPQPADEVPQAEEAVEADQPEEIIESDNQLDEVADDEALAVVPDEAAQPEPAVQEEVADEIILAVRVADVSNGQMLFNMPTEAGFACSNCHLVDSEQRLVGPGMYGLPQRTSQRVADEVPERYLYNSIVHPNDHIVADYAENVMPLIYDDIFTDEQVHDLVAYLMTLQDPALATPEPPADVAAVDAEESAPAVEEDSVEAAVEDEAVVEEAVTDTQADAPTPETIIIIVTATPSVPQSTDQLVAIPTPTSDPNAEPDIIVTLVNLGLPSFGEQIFAAECSSCHVVNSEAVIDGNPGLQNIAGRVLNNGIVAERYLYDVVAQGHNALGVSYALNDAQLLDVVAYLMTLNDQ